MALDTFSIFYYGFEFTDGNNKLNFDEGGGELTATITPGTYPLSQVPAAVKLALDTAGNNTYTVTIDRDTRQFSITSTANFDLLISSGSFVGSNAYSELGFSGSDLTGMSSYTSNNAAGLTYEPQFQLQDYIDPESFIERVDATNNESASGRVESVAFGQRKFINLSVKFITNKPMDNKVIKNNPTGKEDFIQFLKFIIKKGRFEFMPNINDRDTFFIVILESLPSSSSGTGYRLRELTSQNLPGFFEINNIVLRVSE